MWAVKRYPPLSLSLSLLVPFDDATLSARSVVKQLFFIESPSLLLFPLLHRLYLSHVLRRRGGSGGDTGNEIAQKRSSTRRLSGSRKSGSIWGPIQLVKKFHWYSPGTKDYIVLIPGTKEDKWSFNSFIFICWIGSLKSVLVLSVFWMNRLQTHSSGVQKKKVGDDFQDRWLDPCVSRDYIGVCVRMEKARKETDGKRASTIHQHDQRPML